MSAAKANSRTTETLAVLAALAVSFLTFPTGATAAPSPRPGINLSGGEFNPKGSRRGVDYDYPTSADVISAAQAGFRVVRLPFLAKRLFAAPGFTPAGETTDIERVLALVDTAARAGLVVVLDMHDYGFTRDGEMIGQTRESTRSFAASWSAVAAAFRERRNVLFGLMNEPHYQSPAMWREAANAAIAAIRGAGAKQGILVPSTDWSVASRWTRNGNSEEMLKIFDPANNFAFELHQYFDHDESGTHDSVREGIGATSLMDFTNWARANGRRAFLGEFAWANNPAAEREGDSLLAFMEANNDVWVGWACWGGGTRWGNYMFALDTSNAQASPQMRILKRHMGQAVADATR